MRATTPFSILKPLAVVAVGACALILGAPAHATIVTYSLNDYVGTGTHTGPFGTVELNDNGGSNVSVTVSLDSGVGFVNTGAGETLMWDLFGTTTPQSSETITGLTSGFSLNVNGSGVHSGGAGDFDYAISCAVATCGHGGNMPYTGTLSFTIDGISLSSFVKNADAFYFASDVCVDVLSGDKCAAGANTGVIAGGPTLTGVPEPATLALFAVGLSALGLALGRRRKSARRALAAAARSAAHSTSH